MTRIALIFEELGTKVMEKLGVVEHTSEIPALCGGEGRTSSLRLSWAMQSQTVSPNSKANQTNKRTSTWVSRDAKTMSMADTTFKLLIYLLTNAQSYSLTIISQIKKKSCQTEIYLSLHAIYGR